MGIVSLLEHRPTSARKRRKCLCISVCVCVCVREREREIALERTRVDSVQVCSKAAVVFVTTIELQHVYCIDFFYFYNSAAGFQLQHISNFPPITLKTPALPHPLLTLQLSTPLSAPFLGHHKYTQRAI